MNAITRILPLALCSTFLMSGLIAQNADQNGDQKRGPADATQAPADPIQAVPQATLAQSTSDEMIELKVSRTTDSTDKFLGVILVSFESHASRYYYTLPHLLTNHAVLAAGFASTDFTYMLKRSRLPKGMKVYTQGVVFDQSGVMTTAIEQLGAEHGVPGDIDA